jgi:hypothetical protein
LRPGRFRELRFALATQAWIDRAANKSQAKIDRQLAADCERAPYMAQIPREPVIGPDDMPITIRVEKLTYGVGSFVDALGNDPNGYAYILLPLAPLIGLALWLKNGRHSTTPWTLYAWHRKDRHRRLIGRHATERDAADAAGRLAEQIKTLGIAGLPTDTVR